MNRAVRIATAALAAAGLLLAGCSTPASSTGKGEESSASSAPVTGGTLNTLRANPFEGFDLDKQTLNSSFQISQAVIEPLIRPNEDGTALAPGLADSWTFNKDFTVLTIALNPRATFSDGEPVTPADVAFSVKTWQSGANYGATFAAIKKVKTIDEHTVAFQLDYPDTALPAFLSWANAGIVPEDFGGRSAADYWQKPIGAGAFTVEKWSTNGEVVLKRSPHYYRDGLPYLDEVVSNFAADPNSVTLQVQSGQVDTADEIGPVTAATLPSEDVHASPQHLTPVLLMNTTDAALSDVKVRQAIGYAVDYAAISATALKGYGVVPTGALPTNSENWAAPTQPYFTHDLDKAKQLLPEAGDAPTTLQLVYPNDASSTLMAQIIQQDLEQAGITVTLQAADSATAFAAQSAGKYQLGIFAYNAISPDVSDPAWYAVATQTMFTGQDPARATDLLNAYSATSDVAEKKTEITALQDLWFEQAPFLALAHTSALTAVRPVVHGADVTLWGTYYLDSVWKSQ